MEQKKMKKRQKKKMIFMPVAVILLLGAGICFGMLLNRKPAQAPTGGVSFDPDAGEYKDPDGAEDGDNQGVSIPGWGTIELPANETEVTVDFHNPEENEGSYNLTFEIRLPDDSEQGYEVLYTSGLVKPGLHIQNITLSRALEAGEYDAVIHVQPYRTDEAQTPTNNADMNTKLIVK